MASAVPLRRGSGTSTSTASSAATNYSSTGASSSRRGFANLSLKPSRPKQGKRTTRPRSAGSSSLEAPAAGTTGPDDAEWARAELEEGDEEGRRISEAMQRAAASREGSRASSVASTSAASTGSLQGEGRLARGLRKTRSGLRLFSKAKEQAAADAAAEAQAGASARDGSAVYAQPSSGGSASLLDLSSSCGVTPTSSAFPSSSSARPSSSDGAPVVPLSPNSNVANRIGGWFSSMLHPGSGPGASTSSLSLPQEDSHALAPAQSPEKARSSAPPRAPSSPASSSSPLKKGSSASSNGGGGVARFGPLDRMLDRAVQYFLDSDSQADRCEDDIWLLGVRHPGWQPPPAAAEEREGGDEEDEGQRRGLSGLGRIGRGSPVKARKGPAPPPQPSFAPALSASTDPSSASSRSSSPAPPPPATTIHGWPASFYHDFYSRPALTYRSHFPLIPCDAPSSTSNGGVGGMLSNLGMSIGRGARAAVPASSGDKGEERGLSTDAGWGCMLRTGQSLLANALVKVHLGRGTLSFHCAVCSEL